MLVCHCRAVTDGTVLASIEGGACSLPELAERCGAGSRCGGCHLILRQLLAAAGLDAVPSLERRGRTDASQCRDTMVS